MNNSPIIHGPPGMGKTTTLVEGIIQLIANGEKILVSAPSNTAVDHIAKELIRQGVKVLRVGNASKVDETIFAQYCAKWFHPLCLHYQPLIP